MIMFAEQRLDLLALAQAQQAVVDEHAGELLADRFVAQPRGDRAVDAARQAAQHTLVADLAADFGALGGAQFAHRPVARPPAAVAYAICDPPGSSGGVDYFPVDL